MANVRQLKDHGDPIFPITHVSLVKGMEYRALMDATYAWDGTGAPDVSKIPAGVVVTYNGTDYTGTLVASASTTGRFYLVPSTTVQGEWDRYMTDGSGSSYAWKPAGNTSIPSPDVVDNETTDDPTKPHSAAGGKRLKDQLGELEAKVTDIAGETAMIGGQDLTKFLVVGKYINTNVSAGTVVDTTPVVSSNWGYVLVPYFKGKAIIISGTGGSSPQLYAFLDKDKKMLSRWSGTATDKEISGNVDGYLVLNFRLEDSYSAFVDFVSRKDYKDLEDELAAEVADIEQTVSVVARAISPTVQIVDGYYINKNGVLSADSNFQMTSPFHLDSGDTLKFSARGYSGTVAVLAKVVGESAYSPVQIGTSTYDAYTYTNAGDDADFVISYEKTSGYEATIFTKSNEYRKISDSAIAVFPFVNKKQYTPTYNATNGYYIGTSGTISTGSSFSLTSAIHLFKGDTISFTAAGYLTSVSMVAKQITGRYITLVRSVDSTARSYSYTATEDVDVYISYITSAGLANLKITPNSQSVIEQLASPRCFASASQLNLATSETGKYIRYNGEIVTSNSFAITEPFTLNKGDALIVSAVGYNSEVAILSKNVPGQANKDVVIVGNNNYTEYCFVNTEETAQFVISYLISSGFYALKLSDKVVAELVKSKGMGVNEYFDSFAFMGIPVVGIIGDSLSCGVTQKADGETSVSDLTLAWWQVLARESGQTYYNFSFGGATTRTWLERWNGLEEALTPGNECCAYVIALGVNDQNSLGMEYLGDADDINLADYTQNADTFYGNYAKIIQRLTVLVPDAKFFATTMPRTDEKYDAFNAAIREISGMFANSYVVDLAGEYLSVFSTGFLNAHKFGGNHQSGAAYQVIGKIFEKAISEVMVAFAYDFRYIQFALDSISQ